MNKLSSFVQNFSARHTLSAHVVVAVLVLGLGGLQLLTGCAPQGGSTPPSARDPYAHLDAEEREAFSEVLADEAEDLIDYPTLNEAYGKFSEATQLNPNNHRALLWKKFLPTLLQTKGILARVRPLYLSQKDGVDRYQAFLDKMIDESTEDHKRRFWTEGPEDIDTEEKFRSWLDGAITEMVELRKFINENKHRKYRLRLPVRFIGINATTVRGKDKCAALFIMNSKFEGCPSSGMFTFKMNRADLEAIQGTVAVQILQLAILYAYNFNPVVLLDGNGSVTPRDYIARLKQGYDGGLLERNRLGLANEIIPDLISAQRYFIQSQAELCSVGRHALNRPGYLLTQGFCVSTKPDGDGLKSLRMLEMMMLGKPVTVELGQLKSPVTVYPMKFMNQPPRNITPLLPTHYDGEGRAQGVDNGAWTEFFGDGKMSDVLEALNIEEDIARDNAAKAAAAREQGQQK